MTLKPQYRFYIALGLLIVSLLAMIGLQERVRTYGKTIILQTQPVDPRDIFRGDYVILTYAIESEAEDILRERYDGNYSNLRSGQSIYISLSSEDPAHVQQISLAPPHSGLYIEGKLAHVSERYAQITFPNLAQFYVPEGTGLPIERRRGELFVEISVHHGNANILRLLDTERNPIAFTRDMPAE